MSQVGIYQRPATQQSLSARLPEIQHPLSRLGSPGRLDVRGLSRSAELPFRDVPHSARPLANETNYAVPRRLNTSGGRPLRASLPQDPLIHDAIPEGVEVTQGDPTKTRLPLFGKCEIYFILFKYEV